MVRKKWSNLDNMDFVPMRRISVLLLFHFMTYKVNQECISARQVVRRRVREQN